MFRIFFACLTFCLLGACNGQQSADISVQNAQIQAPIGGRDVTLGGFEISAAGQDITLMSASSPAVKKIELHTMTQTDGVMKMRRLEDGLTIRAGDTLTLGSGGPHLMIFGLDPALQAGDMVEISVNYSQGGRIQPPLSLNAVIYGLGEEREDHSGHGS